MSASSSVFAGKLIREVSSLFYKLCGFGISLRVEGDIFTGIISISSIMLGVATAHALRSNILLSGVAGLTAGAMSMLPYLQRIVTAKSTLGAASCLRNKQSSTIYTQNRLVYWNANTEDHIPHCNLVQPKIGSVIAILK